MITPKEYGEAKAATAADLHAFPGVSALLEQLLPLVAAAGPDAAHIAYACLFGNLCADQELLGCDSDKTGLVDFEQRLALFTIYARTVYKECLTFNLQHQVHGKVQ